MRYDEKKYGPHWVRSKRVILIAKDDFKEVVKFITSLNQGLKCRGYKLETYYALTFSCSSYNYAHIAKYCKNTGLNVIFGEEITPDFQDREAWADILHFERNEFCEIPKLHLE